jgi:molecular chaperone DnaJ
MGFGQFVNVTVCPTCQGRGKSIRELCKVCKGDGRVQEESVLKVNVPAGVSEGNYLTLGRQGHAGKRGGPAGDALVVIQEIEHDIFLRDGDDIVFDLEITVPQALLGAEVDVPTLSGHSLLKIQSGTSAGSILRMRNKGIKHLQHSGTGDQLVRIQIATPSKLTKEERGLLEKLSKLEHFRAKGTSASSKAETQEAEPVAEGLFESIKGMFA